MDTMEGKEREKDGGKPYNVPISFGMIPERHFMLKGFDFWSWEAGDDVVLQNIVFQISYFLRGPSTRVPSVRNL